MSNLSGMSPVTIRLTDSLLQLVQGLKTDKVYQVRVGESLEGLSVKVSGVRIALPQNSTFVSGQAVTVELQTTSGTPQVLIQPASTVPGGASVSPESMTILQQVMNALPGFPSFNPQEGAALVPSVLPSTEAIIRLALQILQLRANVPEAANTVIRVLNQLVTSGEARPEASQLLALLGGETDLSKPDSIARFLKLLQEHTQHPPLASLTGQAAPSSPGISMANTHLYLLLAGMRNNESIQSMLEPGRGLETFQRAIETLMDHSAGQHLQNARALEVPYSYMNIPFGDSAVSQAQIHIFGEGQGQNSWKDGKSGQIVLDLETSRLGSMWIQIQHNAEQCTCRFDVASEEIAAHINEAASTLEARLEGISFKQVKVSGTVWDGDHMKAVAALFQQYSGLDVTA